MDTNCTARHPDDQRPCDGPPIVRIVDQTGEEAVGCQQHGPVLLASLHRGRVYPLPGADGAAIAVFKEAQTLPPFTITG